MGNTKEIRQMFLVILHCYIHDGFFQSFSVDSKLIADSKIQRLNNFDVKNEQI